MVMTVLRDEPGEVFAIICLSTKHRVIAYHEVSRGTLDATLVHPREVSVAEATAQRLAEDNAGRAESGGGTSIPAGGQTSCRTPAGVRGN